MYTLLMTLAIIVLFPIAFIIIFWAMPLILLLTGISALIVLFAIEFWLQVHNVYLVAILLGVSLTTTILSTLTMRWIWGVE